MSSLKENQIKESLKELIPTGNSMEVLKKFEDRYEFSRYDDLVYFITCLLYTSPSPRDATLSRMPSSA